MKGKVKKRKVEEKTEVEIVLFDPRAKNFIVGDRLIVNWKSKVAYHMGYMTDRLIGKVKTTYLPNMNYRDWATKNGIRIVPREPTYEELEEMFPEGLPG